ncbi:uncharacterized protein LOC135925970 isoform X3 [Gordionus sp. m RMFG-2023]|uniref:uncharacterized protein LOC135925970 isoform X3 n=1 Tax=Gordionus sp. m RMFG-2023 TaxID=3053472 RepID=UPI0031FBC435
MKYLLVILIMLFLSIIYDSEGSKGRFFCYSHLILANTTIEQCILRSELYYICDRARVIDNIQKNKIMETIIHIKKYSSYLNIFKNCTNEKSKGINFNIILIPPNNVSNEIPKNAKCNQNFIKLVSGKRQALSLKYPCSEYVLFLIYGNNLWISMGKNVQLLAKRHALFRFLNSVSSYENFSIEGIIRVLLSGFTKLTLDSLKAQSAPMGKYSNIPMISNLDRIYAGETRNGNYNQEFNDFGNQGQSKNRDKDTFFLDNYSLISTTPKPPKLIFKSKTMMSIIGFICVLLVTFTFFCVAFMRSHLSRYFASASPIMVWQHKKNFQLE